MMLTDIEYAADDPVSLLRKLIEANKVYWAKRTSGFKGDHYWQVFESHLDYAEEWLERHDAARSE